MSRKKADSNLPSELNENWGSNYMMDGFWQDMEYEHGLKENPAANPIPQPSTGGLAHLPGGVIVSENVELNNLPVPEGVEREYEGGMELGELGIVASVGDRSDAGITDFSWLGDAVQDPNRLPNHPYYDVIPELQEAWGNRTDGINRIDLVDRPDVQYQDAFQGPEDDDTLNAEKLASMARSAMRRSAAGDLSYAQKCKGHPKMVRAMQAIEAEHGLVGNVYIRASAYPRLHRGKYAKEFKKAAKGCRYLIAEANEFTRDVANTLHLRVVPAVSNIDWNDTYERYSPRLAATGRLNRMATITDKKEALRRAFLTDEASPRLDIETTKNKVTMPVDQVTAAQAQKTLAEFKPPQREVINWVQRAKKAEAEQVIKKLGAWVQARLLSKEDVDQLIRSKAPPREILRTASALISSTKDGTYLGAGRGHVFHALKKEAAVTRKDWERDLQSRAKSVLAKDRALLVDNVTKMVTAGVISQAQANTLLATGVGSRVAMRAASKVASTTRTATYNQGTARHQGAAHASTDANPEAVRRHIKQAAHAQTAQDAKSEKARQASQVQQAHVEVLLQKVGRIEQLVSDGASKAKLKKALKANFTLDDMRLIHARLEPILVRGKFYEKEASSQYEGAVLTRAQQAIPQMSVSPAEIRKAARWLRQTMSEGSAGPELDQLIQLRLEPKMLKAGASRIATVRETHEGLSGHLYVDAGAYLSKTGTTGCDKGALRHRANQLKFLLAAKRCDGCVYKNADGVCQKYNKMVVDEIPAENVENYRQQAIASHSTPDQQHTADLFSVPNLAPALGPGAEFGLHNSSLDDVGTDAPEPNMLDGIFFGGFEI
jgi:hypothetical protein